MMNPFKDAINRSVNGINASSKH